MTIFSGSFRLSRVALNSPMTDNSAAFDFRVKLGFRNVFFLYGGKILNNVEPRKNSWNKDNNKLKLKLPMALSPGFKH